MTRLKIPRKSDHPFSMYVFMLKPVISKLPVSFLSNRFLYSSRFRLSGTIALQDFL